jgi:hypothetical protein
MSTISFLSWHRQDFSVDELVTDMLQNSFQAFRVATLNKPGVLIVSLLEVHLVIRAARNLHQAHIRPCMSWRRGTAKMLRRSIGDIYNESR